MAFEVLHDSGKIANTSVSIGGYLGRVIRESKYAFVTVCCRFHICNAVRAGGGRLLPFWLKPPAFTPTLKFHPHFASDRAVKSPVYLPLPLT